MLNTEILGIGSLIYGGIYTDPVMFYSYPCIHLGSIFERYSVTKRPWYTKALLEHSKSNHEEYSLKFTDPYVCIQPYLLIRCQHSWYNRRIISPALN